VEAPSRPHEQHDDQTSQRQQYQDGGEGRGPGDAGANQTRSGGRRQPDSQSQPDGDRTDDHRYQPEQPHGPENLDEPDQQRAADDDLGQEGMGAVPGREEIPP
jgi:hypothetical protein